MLFTENNTYNIFFFFILQNIKEAYCFIKRRIGNFAMEFARKIFSLSHSKQSIYVKFFLRCIYLCLLKYRLKKLTLKHFLKNHVYENVSIYNVSVNIGKSNGLIINISVNLPGITLIYNVFFYASGSTTK